jgi:hypothetical protein
MNGYFRTKGWQEHFDFLAAASWCSFGLLLTTQLCIIDLDWIPNMWSISIIGLASCLALSELRHRRAQAKMDLLRAESTTDPLTGRATSTARVTVFSANVGYRPLQEN